MSLDSRSRSQMADSKWLRQVFPLPKKGHMSRKCQSSNKCNHCKGTHQVSLCHKKATGTKESATEEKLKSHTCTKLALNPQAPPFENTHTYAILSSNREVLLQTAQAVILIH